MVRTKREELRDLLGVKLSFQPFSPQRLPYDVTVVSILSIPPSSHAAVDAICWHYEKRGSYSVKSEYWLSMQSDDAASSSSTSSASVSGWLPSFFVLEARKVPTGSICPLCKVGSETPVHALWSCYKLKPVR
ncbi:hypothetical protein ACOSQ2_010513 [Xanthoceras sorbifolium]